MDLALYADGVGYYASGAARVGRAGDYFTSVSVGPALGLVMARHCLAAWRAMGCPLDFCIVEQGANDGALAGDILAALAGTELAGCVQYKIIEPLAVWRDRQRARLGGDPRVSWFESTEESPAFTGIHLSNELVDALPFHIVSSRGDAGWDELFVDACDGKLQFIECPPTREIQSMVADLPRRPEGYLTELRPAAADWIAGVAGILRSGYLLVIDYGMERERLLDPARTRGTFSAYQHHRRDENVLVEPGNRDLTAHVDFSELTAAGCRSGLVPDGLTDQHHFVVRCLAEWLREREGQPPDQLLRGVKMLMHPSTMGMQFGVLGMRTSDAPTGVFPVSL